MGRKSASLKEYTTELVAIFKSAPSKHDAHERSRRVLLDMAADPGCLRAVLAAQIQRPGGLNERHFPSLGLPIESNAHFNLVANCFLPLPSAETDVTTNSIHHHGDLLLTTVTTFGPGYDHWRFTTPRLLDAERDLFSIDVVDREAHSPNHATFVDCFTPHAVMYPPSLTVTFALWSSRHAFAWPDSLKRVAALGGIHTEWLRATARRLGLGIPLRIHVPTYLDFYPVKDGFKGMRDRIQFQRGPNEDYLHTMFHVLQQTNNDDLAPDGARRARGPLENPRLIERLAHDLRRGVPIPGRFSEGLHWLPHMNFKIHSIEEALGALKATRRSFDATAT